MDTKWIIGNWKMHGSREGARALAAAIRDFLAPAHAWVVLCPPFTLLTEVEAALQGSKIGLGGQDCHAEKEGAYTGDISANMLKEGGCAFVIVGHSERRQYHRETDIMVKAKAEAALAAGLTPIICVGETWEQRRAGQAEAVVAAQVKACLPSAAGQVLLAYEPVWAIGSGQTPTLEEIAVMHACLYSVAGREVPVLYGGSVKPGNAKEILAIPHVGGALVGGASLKAVDFCAIIAAA